MSYTIRFRPAAKRDLWNQIRWLEDNRSIDAADKFETQLNALLDRLQSQPYFSTPIYRPAGLVRKALINKRSLLFYTILEVPQEIEILAIRGAAEDWTNQSLPK